MLNLLTKQKQERLTVGGQAVIEGVMMRSPWRIATAVRDPEGNIQVKAAPFVSISKRHPIAKLPVFRGAIGLFEALKIGMDSLTWSAEIAGEEDADRKITIWDRILEGLMMVVAFAFGIGLFMAVPYAVAGLIPREDNQVFFHLVAGFLRIGLLIGYMGAISLIPDIREVFKYHGAEHKSIFTFEKKLDLNIATACTMTRLHPRCGTSFILLAGIMTMILFMLFDSIWVYFLGNYSGVFQRVIIHLPVIPLMAGLSYEVLRFLEVHSDEPVWQPLIKPGLMLQRITTREPNESQVEVAIAALKESLLKDEGEYEGLERNGIDKETSEENDSVNAESVTETANVE